MKTPFNKFLYIGFVGIGLFQAFSTHEYLQAASSMGIALAFDPFDTEQKWDARPFWQKAVLILHLVLVGLLFGIGFMYKNN